ncbi:hypothetical protein K438DRAFT_1970986 [Mycena galopus ATCC 62051]|nr:hypothetical protein K438DRAFT_1970986 [Mycena galopus ATCC 62051]
MQSHHHRAASLTAPRTTRRDARMTPFARAPPAPNIFRPVPPAARPRYHPPLRAQLPFVYDGLFASPPATALLSEASEDPHTRTAYLITHLASYLYLATYTYFRYDYRNQYTPTLPAQKVMGHR